MYLLINILMLIVVLGYLNFCKIKNLDMEKDKFDGKFFNILYLLSYSIPLKYFLIEKGGLRRKEKKIKEKIIKLNLTDKFNLRSFMALRFLLLFVSLSLFLCVMFVSKEPKGSSFFVCLTIFLLIPFIPNLVLKVKEEKYKKFYHDEVVILQLFMILLIKSNSTIENILFAFSKMNTFYKKSFEKAYRVSLRNKKEALLYLENKFEDTVFGNSFNVLNNMSEYSKNDSIRILEANLKRIEKESISKKRKEELSKFSFSQISVIVPFSIVIFLGAIPVIQYAINMIINAIQGL